MFFYLFWSIFINFYMFFIYFFAHGEVMQRVETEDEFDWSEFILLPAAESEREEFYPEPEPDHADPEGQQRHHPG